MSERDWDAYASDHLAKTLIEDQKLARVTYRNEGGQRFRVIVRQKPNGDYILHEPINERLSTSGVQVCERNGR